MKRRAEQEKPRAMKILKNIGLVLLIPGIVLIIAAFIWFALEPSSWNPLGPFFIGVSLLAIDLLGLVVFSVYKITYKKN